MIQLRTILGMLLVTLFSTLFTSLLAATPVALGEEPDRQAALVGAGIFRAYCASCHGIAAKGDGALAELLKVKPANLTQIAQRRKGGFSVEEVQKIIDGRTPVKGHGHGEMPVWGDALQIAAGGATEEQVEKKIYDLAQYLWTIQEE